jgi:hypothetical protein
MFFLTHPHSCPILVLLPNGGNWSQEEPIMPKRQFKAEYLGVAELEALTGISRWTWRRWAYSGRVASVKLGKRLVVPVAEMERLIAENIRPNVEVR